MTTHHTAAEADELTRTLRADLDAALTAAHPEIAWTDETDRPFCDPEGRWWTEFTRFAPATADVADPSLDLADVNDVLRRHRFPPQRRQEQRNGYWCIESQDSAGVRVTVALGPDGRWTVRVPATAPAGS